MNVEIKTYVLNTQCCACVVAMRNGVGREKDWSFVHYPTVGAWEVDGKVGHWLWKRCRAWGETSIISITTTIISISIICVMSTTAIMTITMAIIIIIVVVSIITVVI